MTVTHVEPTKPSPSKVTEAFRETILAALENGPLTGRQLARAAKVKSTERSFARARLGLVNDGQITQSTGDGTAAKTYALVEQP